MCDVQAELTRTIRFCLRGDGSVDLSVPMSNAFAAWPPMRGLGRYYQLHLTCVGEVDAATGYLVNITLIDRVVREHGLPVIAEAAGQADPLMGTLMQQVAGALAEPLPVALQSIVLQLTPTHTLGMKVNDMSQVLITQQYDFSAAHRLHVPQLSDDRNREIFGKCNNPSGHGHNYRIEVGVVAPIAGDGSLPLCEQLDELVDTHIIERFDHKHLNIDTPEFADANPSVEHIARVIYDLLVQPVQAMGVGLEHVRVWETEKTCCTYRG